MEILEPGNSPLGSSLFLQPLCLYDLQSINQLLVTKQKIFLENVFILIVPGESQTYFDRVQTKTALTE